MACKTPALNRRITIQATTETRDSYGGVSAVWSTVATVWASVLPVSGREFFASEASQAEVNYKIVIRRLTSVLPSMRIVYDGHQYNIRAVLPDQTPSRHMVLMCERGDVVD